MTQNNLLNLLEQLRQNNIRITNDERLLLKLEHNIDVRVFEKEVYNLKFTYMLVKTLKAANLDNAEGIELGYNIITRSTKKYPIIAFMDLMVERTSISNAGANAIVMSPIWRDYVTKYRFPDSDLEKYNVYTKLHNCVIKACMKIERKHLI